MRDLGYAMLWTSWSAQKHVRTSFFLYLRHFFSDFYLLLVAEAALRRAFREAVAPPTLRAQGHACAEHVLHVMGQPAGKTGCARHSWFTNGINSCERKLKKIAKVVTQADFFFGPR